MPERKNTKKLPFVAICQEINVQEFKTRDNSKPFTNSEFFSIRTYNSDRSLIFFAFLLIHMDEIPFANKNKKFKSFGNEQKCQIKNHAPGLKSGQFSSF